MCSSYKDINEQKPLKHAEKTNLVSQKTKYSESGNQLRLMCGSWRCNSASKASHEICRFTWPAHVRSVHSDVSEETNSFRALLFFCPLAAVAEMF